MSAPCTPSAPDPAFLHRLQAETHEAMVTASPLTSDFTGAPADLGAAVTGHAEGLTEDLHRVVHRLHGDPETAYEEHRTVEFLVGLLAEHGVEAEVGTGEVATAFRAETGSGSGPAIAICAEYDALPEVGHACGHNVIAASAVGAFLALHAQATADPGSVPGRVVLFGTPAEEGHTGKEVMAQGGAFEGIDAAIMVHPFGDDVADMTWLGRRLLTLTFTGVAAHASAQPFMGRNALDAANLAYQGIALMRQQMPPSDRVHAVIVEGGNRPNVITERSVVNLYARSAYPETLRLLSSRLEEIAEGAALMTGTAVELAWDTYPPSMPVRGNRALLGRWTQTQHARGRSPLPPGVLPAVLAGSTDFGNLSYRMPAMHPMIKISDSSVALHTRDFATAAGSPAGELAAVDAAVGLARTALDYLHDADLRAQVHAEFDAAGGAIDVAGYFD